MKAISVSIEIQGVYTFSGRESHGREYSRSSGSPLGYAVVNSYIREVKKSKLEPLSIATVYPAKGKSYIVREILFNFFGCFPSYRFGWVVICGFGVGFTLRCLLRGDRDSIYQFKTNTRAYLIKVPTFALWCGNIGFIIFIDVL